MTEIIKELLEHYQVRKTKKQKTAFLNWLTPFVKREGYAISVEKGSMGARNIIIGDPDRAKVVFTAHYDTCAVLPFPNFITPKNLAVYLLYQFGMAFLIMMPAFFIPWLLFLITGFYSTWMSLLLAYGVLGLMILGPANKHTVNDNTSGVAAVLELMQALPEHLRQDAAFILFDLEEAGLFGSASFAGKHKKLMKSKPLVNFDCVSDGETMLFVFRKKANHLLETFQQAFPEDSRAVPEFGRKGYIYPSDQVNFSVGIGVSAMKRTKLGMLYLDRIHTPKDTVYREENIDYLVDGSIRLMEIL